MRISQTPTPNKPQAKPTATGLLGLNGTTTNIDVYLGGSDYQNVPEHQSAKMLGHFTQTMQDQGFPWRLFEATKEGLQGKLTGQQTISDLDALRRLQQGKGVIFQPMRNLQLDLSSDSIGALAAAGSVGGGDTSSINKLANLTKNTRVQAGNQGFEVSHGEPIEVRNTAELKLLYQMYNPEEKLTSKDEVAKTAHHLAYFNKQSGDFGWRYYAKDDSNPVGRVVKAFGKNALRGAAMGAALGASLGAFLGLFTSSISNAAWLFGLSTAGFALYEGYGPAQAAAKGKPLTTVEALDRLVNKSPVEFQETQMRSIGIPIVGKLGRSSDRGKASTIHDPSELETFWRMQNQGAPEEEKPPEPPKPTVVVVDQSVHHHHYPRL
jgi:hypothetical protein